MTNQTLLALYAELDSLGTHIVRCIQNGKDEAFIKVFQNRFDAIQTVITLQQHSALS